MMLQSLTAIAWIQQSGLSQDRMGGWTVACDPARARGTVACSFFTDARLSSIRVCASRVARHEVGKQLLAACCRACKLSTLTPANSPLLRKSLPFEMAQPAPGRPLGRMACRAAALGVQCN